MRPVRRAEPVNVDSTLSRVRRWAKKLGEAVTARNRTEITIETDRVLIIRGRRSKRVWCEKCGRDVDTVGRQDVRTLTGESHPMLPAGAELGGWHLCADQDAAGDNAEPRVCLDSLLKSLQNSNQEKLRARTLRGGVS
jgi:hypothetical protein